MGRNSGPSVIFVTSSQCTSARGAAFHQQTWGLILFRGLGLQQLDPKQPLGLEIVEPDILDVQSRHLRSPPSAGRKGQHEHGAVADAAMAVVAGGKKSFQNVPRYGLG
jgi:hypothetical protein